MKSVNVLVLALALGACGGEEEETVTPIMPGAPGAAVAPGETPATPATPEAPATPEMPTVTLSPEDTARVAEVSGQLNEYGRFPREVTSDKTLAMIFLHLAATSDDVNMIKATMDGMSGMFSVVPSYVERGATLVDETYVGVMAARVYDERPEVRAAGLVGAAVCFRRGNTNMVMLEHLLTLANGPDSTPALRYAVLNTIWQSQEAFDEQHMPFIVSALNADEPWLVSLALFRVKGNVPHDEAYGAPIRAKLLELTSHADPGVRGRAIAALAAAVSRLPEADAERTAAIARSVEMLADPHPYAKSEAINAQSTLQNVAVLPQLSALLDDATSNTYDIRGWQTIAGQTGRVHHDGSAWSQVRDSALAALRSLSRRIDRENQFEYRINGGTSAEDLTAAATAGQAWIAAHPPAAE